MKSLLAALSFLTRLPAGRRVPFDAKQVARAAGWFPLIGIFLGAVYALAAAILRPHLPFALIAVMLIALDALLTGALHLDGLADTADGFGGGQGREDVLRIMRDHNIGSYGATALILCIALKAIAFTILLQREYWVPALILTPALGRWSLLLLPRALPYARPTPSVIQEMGKAPLFWGTGTIAVALGAAQFWRVWAAAATVLIVTLAFGFYCRRMIAGITGDTLGANLELCECAALVAFLWTGQS
jgi:adenosylcobinamide-GDP ribazoletransferase